MNATSSNNSSRQLSSSGIESLLSGPIIPQKKRHIPQINSTKQSDDDQENNQVFDINKTPSSFDFRNIVEQQQRESTPSDELFGATCNELPSFLRKPSLSDDQSAAINKTLNQTVDMEVTGIVSGLPFDSSVYSGGVSAGLSSSDKDVNDETFDMELTEAVSLPAAGDVFLNRTNSESSDDLFGLKKPVDTPDFLVNSRKTLEAEIERASNHPVQTDKDSSRKSLEMEINCNPTAIQSDKDNSRKSLEMEINCNSTAIQGEKDNSRKSLDMELTGNPSGSVSKSPGKNAYQGRGTSNHSALVEENIFHDSPAARTRSKRIINEPLPTAAIDSLCKKGKQKKKIAPKMNKTLPLPNDVVNSPATRTRSKQKNLNKSLPSMAVSASAEDDMLSIVLGRDELDGSVKEVLMTSGTTTSSKTKNKRRSLNVMPGISNLECFQMATSSLDDTNDDIEWMNRYLHRVFHRNFFG